MWVAAVRRARGPHRRQGRRWRSSRRPPDHGFVIHWSRSPNATPTPESNRTCWSANSAPAATGQSARSAGRDSCGGHAYETTRQIIASHHAQYILTIDTFWPTVADANSASQGSPRYDAHHNAPSVAAGGRRTHRSQAWQLGCGRRASIACQTGPTSVRAHAVRIDTSSNRKP